MSKGEEKKAEITNQAESVLYASHLRIQYHKSFLVDSMFAPWVAPEISTP
jgi:hypothetical protein